ncbi:riboflavin synthase [Cryomorphaceae bacterium 1068]|nr:riboflavin synthase [Cryomorphaceae bacterium 1068]
MFTGIIETMGAVRSIAQEGQNIHFTIKSNVSDDLKIDQSIAHDGVCLTVVDLSESAHVVTAIAETLRKTSLGNWKVGTQINLERCMPMTGRFDGHIVQGHVDTTGKVTEIYEEDGSWRFFFEHEESIDFMTVSKGSITINGVSLTVVDSSPTGFSVAIIPYTYEHTNFKNFTIGETVNLEFDIIGKYVREMMRREPKTN